MTSKQKEKAFSWLEIAYKFVVMGLLSLILIQGPKIFSDIVNRTFTTVENRVKTEEYISSAPNEVDTYLAFKTLDSLTKNYAKDRALEVSKQADRDTLIKRNSVTIYQIKEQQKEQTRITKEILQKLNNH